MALPKAFICLYNIGGVRRWHIRRTRVVGFRNEVYEP